MARLLVIRVEPSRHGSFDDDYEYCRPGRDSLPFSAVPNWPKPTIKRVPTRAAFRAVLRFLWRFGISSIPPEALPYMLGSCTMDTGRLQQFLGTEYPHVIQYTIEDALRDSFNNSG